MGNTQSSQELSSSAQPRSSHGSFSSTNSRKNSINGHGSKNLGLTSQSFGPDSGEASSLPSASGTRTFPTRRVQIKKSTSPFSESPFVGSPLIHPDDLLPQTVSSSVISPLSSSPKHSQEEIPRAGKHVTFGKRRVSSSLRDSERNLDESNLPQPDIFPSSLPDTKFTLPKETAEKIKKGVPNPLLDEQGGLPTLISWNSPAKNVYVTGTFNGWKHKIPLNKSVNEFSTVVSFPPGIHHIKFIVDDEWKCSNELLTATDHDGNLVNYIEVDSLSLPIYEPHTDIISTSPPGEYSSQIPEFNLNPPTTRRGSTASTSADPNAKNRPPALPPHLEKVILNAAPLRAETPGTSTEDYWLLPVPNHVVLNHLYACSIRDGVMAVAGTTRYRSKYVTTIYYKPVVI
ncbi:galactose metabolism- protein [Entomophthora muscae]|uniref:Galactose metabolism- protein n=1 Tax=Entomophthora muscae TaxID=34485 RepID=A0ACC2TD27_9FUNG|nr:galactose metabolism- protein [Entomophthora muscae]